MTPTPKKKAQELFDKYYLICQEFTEEIQCGIQAKQCALIAVDEILDNFGLVCNGQTFYTEHRAFDYYSEVKQELIKSE